MRTLVLTAVLLPLMLLGGCGALGRWICNDFGHTNDCPSHQAGAR